MVFTFFIYGLAFFSMGLAVWLESGRTSGFRSIRIMRYLAGFGILHGLHEWIEAFTILHDEGIVELASPFLINWLDITILIVSFILLVTFGWRMIYVYQNDDGRKRTFISVSIFVLIWAVGTAVALTYYKPCLEGCMDVADVVSRYTLGIPGALLAAWAMLLQRRGFQKRGMGRCAQDIRWAVLALFLYGVVGQLFTKETALFPSTIINSDLFLQLFGFPVQIFRAAAACVVAVFIIRALRGFEMERQQQLIAANEARQSAQQEALATQQHARIETEKLNQELQTAVQDLTMLFELSRSLAATLNLDALLQKTMAQVFESVPRIEGGMIFIQDKAERPLQQMVSVGYDDDQSETDGKTMKRQAQAIGEYVFEAGQSAGWSGDVIIPLNDLARQSEQGTAETGVIVMGIPLTVQERIAGSLVISLNPQATSFTQNDFSLINTVASQLSMAVENATLYQEVQAREERRGELLHQVVSAQEMEQQRIARELHDGAGQMLTALGLGLAAASESVTHDPERGVRQLVELKEMSGQVIQELQNVVVGLRPSVLDDLGLVPAIRGLIKDFETQTAVQTTLEVSGRQRRIQPEIETVMFRIIQEALTNILKHARANAARVTLTFRPHVIQLSVWDDGCGFDPDEALQTDPKRHWGLLGIDERVNLHGGQWKISSHSGAGTTIQVTIPLSEEIIHVRN